MATMSCLQAKHPDKATAGHDHAELPAVLSEMQAENSGECPTIEYVGYQRAGR